MNEGERAALTGELGQVPLWDILQTLQLWSSPGCVEVDGSHELATLHFCRGTIVSARCGLRRGEAAVYRALRLQRGRFTVRRSDELRGGQLSLSITAAILEGVRRHDECERLRATLPDEGVVLSWLGGRIPVDLRGRVSDVVELFVVPRTIDEAVRASSEDELSLLEELVALVPRLSRRVAPDAASPSTTSSVMTSALPLPSPPSARRGTPPSMPARRTPSAGWGAERAAVHGDDERVPVPEPDRGEALVEQSTFEPFVYEPPADAPSSTSTRAVAPRSSGLSPRVLALLVTTATSVTFLATLALLPASPRALGSFAPHVERWLQEAWPCPADAPPPPAVAEWVCGSR